MNTEKIPKISVIIVSYNACAFLELCLWSIQKALAVHEAEILLIDNQSGDNTLKMVTEKFPFVKIIENTVNLGFGRANNKALHVATGDIALLLNPDTIIPEDTFPKIISHYQKYPDCGGLGVKMINGAGEFLPESKRGIPTIGRSLGKLTKLYKVFPFIDSIKGYYSTSVKTDECKDVEILSGAFMAFPLKQLKESFFFNERFFMYGEDIDLSFRLMEQYGKNYYDGQLPIIHFKGESTPTNSDMLYHFYNAMWIFYDIHFKASNKSFVNLIVKSSIRLIIFISKLILPLRRKKQEKKQQHGTSAKTLIIQSNNHKLTQKLKEKYPEATINYATKDSLSTINYDKNTHILFDLASTNPKSIISLISQINSKATFGFISPRQDFILYSGDSNKKGQIIPLK